ncbi:MAG TPA: HEAT repeat domain-containing protein, partial [Armatimonadota bacterium]
AAKALGMLEQSSAGDPLLAALEDESWEVRGAAARALADIGEERALQPLLGMITDERVADSVVDALHFLLAHFSFRLDAGDLQALATLKGFTLQSAGDDGIFFGGNTTTAPAKQVNCAELNKLAREELQRRGVAVQA